LTNLRNERLNFSARTSCLIILRHYRVTVGVQKWLLLPFEVSIVLNETRQLTTEHFGQFLLAEIQFYGYARAESAFLAGREGAAWLHQALDPE
jgi:hypothetical protein